MKDYHPIGPKPQHFKEYHIINWLRDYISELNQEDIDAYNLAVGKLFRWVDLAVQVRHEDVLKRTLRNMQLKKEREEALQAEEERMTERKNHLDEERTRWEEEQEAIQKEKEQAKQERE